MFPVLTIPVGLILALAFGRVSRINPVLRLAVLSLGTGLFFMIL